MKFSNFSFADKIKNARLFLIEKLPYKSIFITTGLLATIWFLLRVIPKPSRAGYPCMRTAAPLMSGFVLYILSLTSSVVIFRKAKAFFIRKNYTTAILLFLVSIFAGGTFFILHNQKPVYAKIAVISEPPDGANNPMGVEHGIMPGRVVWAWNENATNDDCENIPGNSFWDYKNNDTLIIRSMVEESVIELTGKTNIQSAWQAIFTNHNLKKYGESRGYQPNEKIFIKINQGTASWLLTEQEKANGFAIQSSGTIQPSWRANYYAATETGPFVVLNILRQLVNIADVPQEEIYIGDPMAHIYDHNFKVWSNEFPNVKYVDKTTEDFNRTYILPSMESSMEYSDKGEILEETVESYFEEMEAADYMINVACLKSHRRAGITLCAKNHFGSITRNGASHLHNSLISISDDGLDQSNAGYKKYRVLVDIMGHKYLGKNTMLFISEGLFGGSASEITAPRKWNMPPFNGHWTNSVFMSLDQVALESVCYDFLRTEYNGINQSEDYPNWLGVDDYLHQAADTTNWPDNFTYNPDNEGPLKSLGVHEHWNNAENMQYSRNLGNDYGIELIQISGELVSSPQLINKTTSLKTFPNPFNNELNIAFGLDDPGHINIALYNLEGKLIEELAHRYFEVGKHKIHWNTQNTNMISGSYIIKLTGTSSIKNYSQSIKVQFIK